MNFSSLILPSITSKNLSSLLIYSLLYHYSLSDTHNAISLSIIIILSTISIIHNILSYF